MQTLSALLLLVVTIGSAFGGPSIRVYEMRSDGLCHQIDPGPSPAGFDEVYDKWRIDVLGGNTVLDRTVRTGGNEVGDDVTLGIANPGTWNSVIFTVSNLSQASLLVATRSHSGCVGVRTELFSVNKLTTPDSACRSLLIRVRSFSASSTSSRR